VFKLFHITLFSPLNNLQNLERPFN